MSPAPHPRMHGLTHVAGGPDPVPGLLPLVTGTVSDIILATGPGAYYKLDETAGDWEDSSGSERHANYVSRDDTERGTGSEYDEADGSLCVTVQGPAPVVGLPASYVGGCDDDFFEFSGSSPFTVSARVRLHSLSTGGSSFSMGVCGNVVVTGGSAPGWGLFVLSENQDPEGDDRAGIVSFRRTSVASPLYQEAVSATPVTTDSWYRLTGTYDGTIARLYLDDVLHATVDEPAVALPSGGNYDQFLIGSCGIAEGVGGNHAPFDGEIDSVLVWDRALTPGEVGGIIDALPGDQTGWVLTLDENGDPVWGPPGVTVEHGGGAPDTTIVDSPNVYLGDPADGDGWHYTAHYETAILYDSNPARFDVPSRTWTRVPFNTVRLLRTWEVEVDGETRQQLLPDDRGLTAAARKGILHLAGGMGYQIPAGPEPVQVIEGFIYPEYPALDPDELPRSDPGPVPDAYARSFRYKDLASGVVLRSNPDPHTQTEWRFFADWQLHSSADGKNIAVLANADNIYPEYPVWAGRPLSLPGPYPQLSPDDTMEQMLTSVGNHGWRYLLQYDHEINYAWSPGRNFCIEAWQDSPWTLRFMTGEYPNFPQRIRPEWQNRPFLSVTYNYDPALINHETGAWVG